VKKYIIFLILFGFFIFFQSTNMYSRLAVRGVTPDFLLITVSITAFFLGPMSGQIAGFLAGIAIDLLSGGLLGMFAFLYTFIGFAVGMVGQRVYSRSILISTTLIFFVTLLKAVLLTIVAALFLRPGYFGFFSNGRVFLEAIFNCLYTLPIFFIVTRFQEKVTE
jgi:rod shape-determining protein MreD